MREALGNTFIVNLILIFLVILSALLIGSVSYSKAYKVKNRIIYTIEKYEGWDNRVYNEVAESLKDIGYPLNINQKKCKYKDGATIVYPSGYNFTNDYRYCVYQYDTDIGYYYGVTAYMHFDIPLLSTFLEFPVYGETKVMYDTKTHITY